jgi:hypothetical protein
VRGSLAVRSMNVRCRTLSPADSVTWDKTAATPLARRFVVASHRIGVNVRRIAMDVVYHVRRIRSCFLRILHLRRQRRSSIFNGSHSIAPRQATTSQTSLCSIRLTLGAKPSPLLHSSFTSRTFPTNPTSFDRQRALATLIGIPAPTVFRLRASQWAIGSKS